MVSWKAYKWALSAAGLWLLGCSATSPGSAEPRFPGYHSTGSPGSVTPAVVDRSRFPARVRRPKPVPAQPADKLADYNQDGQYPSQFDFLDQYNLVHYLYGPDYYRPYGERYWLQYRRQWSSLPWYGWAPGYNDWWYDPYWSWEYRWNSYAWDPAFDRFFDPWYWDPYSGYGSGYGWGYGSGYGYSYAGYYRNPNRHYWRGGSRPMAGDSKKRATKARSRRRKGSLDSMTGGTLAGAANMPMPKSSGNGSASNSSTKKSSGNATKSQSAKSKSNKTTKATKRTAARKRKRKG